MKAPGLADRHWPTRLARAASLDMTVIRHPARPVIDEDSCVAIAVAKSAARR
jgi:hypothetical protein